jgi:hypothetical protein
MMLRHTVQFHWKKQSNRSRGLSAQQLRPLSERPAAGKKRKKIDRAAQVADAVALRWSRRHRRV